MLARVLVGLVLLVAVFVMHGPSTDHMLAAGGPSMNAASGQLMGEAATTTAQIVAGTHGRQNQAMAAMGMSECLATLRSSTGPLSAPAVLSAVTAPILRVSQLRTSGSSPPDRALDRTALCIWRT